QSTALMQIAIRSQNNQADYNNLLASDQLVQTEAQLAISDPVLREVASHYKGLSVDQLLKEVSSTTELNTQLFRITVLDASPTRVNTGTEWQFLACCSICAARLKTSAA